MSWRWHYCILAALTAGCSSEATQLLVLIDSDYPVDTLAEVRVRVGTGEATLGEERFDTTRFALPVSFGITPPGGDPGGSVTIVAEARGSGERVLSSRRVTSGFIEGRILLLPIFLPRSCQGIQCSDDLTCTEEGCRSPEVSPSDLEPIEPGDEENFRFPPVNPPSVPQTTVKAVQTSGGGALVSPRHRMSVYVGAPQPSREYVSSQKTLRLGAE